MNRNMPLISMLALLLAVPGFAKDKKKHANRAMIEKMEAVPCGAKEHGLTGLGSLWGSVGVTHVNSDEKLCPQYLLRTDDMEYHVRPLDQFDMRVPDGDRKMRHYQVVAMKPIEHSETPAPANYKYDTPRRDDADKPLADKNYADKNIPKNPDKPNGPQ